MTTATILNQTPTRPAWPPAVALAGWLLPGAGYWLIGHRSRGVVTGITIIALFVMGLLIGGVRALDVPGYGSNGKVIELVRGEFASQGMTSSILLPVEQGSSPDISNMRYRGGTVIGPVMLEQPFTEIRDKPWSIAQIMAGPVAVLSGAWAVEQSRLTESPGGLVAAGAKSHARLNEIGVLYTAVAGMLNLMVIIDAAFRDARAQARRGPNGEGTLMLPISGLLADAAYSYFPFYGPLPVWANSAWPWLLLPLVIGVSIVYKAIRVDSMRDLPRQAASITLWILVGMAAAGAVLVGIVRYLQRA